jgi:regulator of sirC expression with transglutaminase-like and TPR domain
MNEADRALEVLNELVEIDSENASNFRRRADLLISFQNYTQALEDLQAGKTLAKHSGNSKEMLLIKQSLTKLHILQSQDSYWAID